MTKYIFFTGGVVSSIGKGISAASLGRLLKNRGLKVTTQKFDPYINVDPGTMSPLQHGEVFVTEDGAEADLDLGHYERFIDNTLNKYSSVTAGKIYSEVLEKERRGELNGATVQVIPHITNQIKEKLMRAAETTDSEIIITEIGGTVGDIESLPHLEALRQMRTDVGAENVLYIHTTLVPYLKASEEMKTKPTQHSVKELRGLGIQPNILILRSEHKLDQAIKDKIALFTDVEPRAVIESLDVETLYSIPLRLQEQHLDDLVLEHFGIEAPQADMTEWRALEQRVLHLEKSVKIAVVGKYVSLPDAYLSSNEALKHAGYAFNSKIDIKWIDSEKLTAANVAEQLSDVQGVLVPGGFGKRGIDGKLEAIRYAREQGVPFLGIGLGMQLVVVEYARHVMGLADAHSTEMNPDTLHPVVNLQDDQHDVTVMGGTLRLGSYNAKLKEGSYTRAIYGGQEIVSERHRNRYEVNQEYFEALEKAGFCLSGINTEENCVDFVEIKDHPFFVATQAHPEFKSRPNRPHPLYREFIKKSLEME
ncbi:CTP synthase [Allofustis seminis]|uniref:CTP synthase n=1 Tax=Allofustis seminis TaxID=166939 RepID=UPI0003811A2C|nr:CTP synthase [Allofustis seminis]